MAPTKNMDRMEWFVEKATELGIDEISLLLCERSERREIKTERLEKTAQAAMKQSMKAFCPKINPLLKLNDFVKKDREGMKMVAHCIEGEKAHLKNLYKPGGKAIVMIGPEGDFSPAEIKNAGLHGFQEIQLGASRLRTETAGILVCAAVQILNEL
jgi:16S rRNA (uracil1498-N3)-methyltransferase